MKTEKYKFRTENLLTLIINKAFVKEYLFLVQSIQDSHD